MDTNNQTPQVATPESKPVSTSPENNNKNMMIMLILGVVVVFLIVGGIYYFLSKQQTANQKPLTQNTSIVPTQAPIAKTQDALDQDLNSINVSASEGDFQSVDQDLKSL